MYHYKIKQLKRLNGFSVIEIDKTYPKAPETTYWFAPNDFVDTEKINRLKNEMIQSHHRTSEWIFKNYPEILL